MSNRFVYFYSFKKVVNKFPAQQVTHTSGIAQLTWPIVNHGDLDRLRAIVEAQNPEVAPIEAFDTLTFLHREKVADE